MSADDRPPHRRPRVVVVGAGISGLAVAWRLTHPRPDASAAGPPSALPEVLVLDGAKHVGGKLRLGSVGGLGIDVGAESMLARRPEAVDLIAETGLSADLVHPAPRSASVLARGRLVPMPAGTVMGVPTTPTAVSGLAGILAADELARAEAEPGIPAPPRTEDVDVASWVAGRMGRAVVDRLVEPLLGGVYAGHADRLSLEATIPYLWLHAVRGGAFLAAPNGGPVLATGSAPSPSTGPSPSIGPAPGGPVFAGLRGGVARLPLTLSERLRAEGVEIRTGTTVRGLRRTPTGWRLETGSAPDPAFMEADAVVLAVPAAPASRLLAAESPSAATELAGMTTASVVVVAIAVPRAQLAGIEASGILVPPIEGTVIKAATFSSNKWPWIGEESGSEMVAVRLSLGRAGEEATLQRDDDELAALAISDLAGLLRRPITPVDVVVTRWGGGLPQYAVGHVARVERIRAAVAQLDRLAICGAVLDGVGVPACIASAGRAVADLRVGGSAAAWTIGA
jgi:oxygen-dependent protoporphyrinogen oxidase